MTTSTHPGHVAHEDHHDHGHDEEHPPEVVWSSKVPTGMMGMMFFIGSEIALFGSFFMMYFFVRVAQSANYSSWAEQMGEAIPLGVATMNSLILFSSSVTIHWATIALKREARGWQSIWLAATLVLGLTFFAIQVMEYGELIGHEKIGPGNNAYSSIFFSLTGLHGSHVVVGAILLAILLVRTLRGHYGPRFQQHIGFEAMSIYWHFVDVVWVFVFGLIYLPGNLGRWIEGGHVWLMAVGIAVLAVLFFLPGLIGKGAPKHVEGH